jgi:hypothetical protein
MDSIDITDSTFSLGNISLTEPVNTIVSSMTEIEIPSSEIPLAVPSEFGLSEMTSEMANEMTDNLPLLEPFTMNDGYLFYLAIGAALLILIGIFTYTYYNTKNNVKNMVQENNMNNMNNTNNTSYYDTTGYMRSEF